MRHAGRKHFYMHALLIALFPRLVVALAFVEHGVTFIMPGAGELIQMQVNCNSFCLFNQIEVHVKEPQVVQTDLEPSHVRRLSKRWRCSKAIINQSYSARHC